MHSKDKLKSKITPDKDQLNSIILIKEQLYEIINTLKNKPFRICFLGSLARGTFLKKGARDLDLFLYYLEKDYIQNWDLFLEQLKDLFPQSQVLHLHSGFPYFRLKKYKGFYVDIVPCVVTDQKEKDRTELHHLYVTSKLTPQLTSEVRLLKHFLKRHHLYGANSEIKGFSGYSVECIVLEFKKLENITPLYHLTDPIDPTRNLLASVSPENLLKFNVLVKNGFKGPKNSLHRNLFFLEDPPLKLYNTLKKDPNVVSVVFTNKVLIVELKDVYKKIAHVDLNNPVWADSSKIYYNNKECLKKYPMTKVLEKYPFLKPVQDSTRKNLYQKTYSFLK